MTRKFLTVMGGLALMALPTGFQLRAQGMPATGPQALASVFQVAPTPNENFNNELFAAAASSKNDIWAVGESTIHFDGTKWTAFEAPQIMGNNTSSLNGVVDFSPTLAWAVGNVNELVGSATQIIEQWNGTEWSIFPSPTFPAHETATLSALTATSPDDMWAVGSLLNSEAGLLFNLFEHWDGTTWAPTSILNPNSGFLLGVSADASDDVWAVGYNGFLDDDSTPVVFHFDGSTWHTVPAPQAGVSDELNAVAALSPSDVWAVGLSWTLPNDPTTTLIEHYDGSEWSVVPSPNVGPASNFQSNRLFGITAVSATNIWAFGSYFAADGSGHQMTLVLHWNGTEWSIVSSPNPTKDGFLSDVLFAGVAPATNDLWIVGGEDAAPNQDTLAIHTSAAPAGATVK